MHGLCQTYQSLSLHTARPWWPSRIQKEKPLLPLPRRSTGSAAVVNSQPMARLQGGQTSSCCVSCEGQRT